MTNRIIDHGWSDQTFLDPAGKGIGGGDWRQILFQFPPFNLHATRLFALVDTLVSCGHISKETQDDSGDEWVDIAELVRATEIDRQLLTA
jgi:hypothetical protein